MPDPKRTLQEAVRRQKAMAAAIRAAAEKAKRDRERKTEQS